MEKETKYIFNAALVNVIQLVLGIIVYILGLFLNINSLFLGVIFMVVQVLIWIICGFRLAANGNIKNFMFMIGASILAVVPILVFLTAGYSTMYFTKVDTQGWSEFFYFIGPLIFFNKPGILLARFFTANGYLIFIVNILILFVSYIIGEIIGRIINPSKNKKVKVKKQLSKEKNVKDKKSKDKKIKKEKKSKKNNIDKEETKEENQVEEKPDKIKSKMAEIVEEADEEMISEKNRPTEEDKIKMMMAEIEEEADETIDEKSITSKLKQEDTKN